MKKRKLTTPSVIIVLQVFYEAPGSRMNFKGLFIELINLKVDSAQLMGEDQLGCITFLYIKCMQK